MQTNFKIKIIWIDNSSDNAIATEDQSAYSQTLRPPINVWEAKILL